MIRSFRLRLALLSALYGGLALAAFGVGAWWLIRDMKLERIDQDVRAHAEREVSRNRSIKDWQRIETKLVSDLGLRNGKDVLLLVEDDFGIIVYRSPDWPAGIDVDRLPWPRTQGLPQGGRSGLMWLFEANAAEGTEPYSSFPANRPRPELRRPAPASTTVVQSINGHNWRIGLAVSDRARVAVAADARYIDGEMRPIRNAFLVAMAIALVLISIGAWWFSLRAMRPLRKLTSAAKEITAERLDQRIDGQGEDREFEVLIDVFNNMLGRLERGFYQARRFSGDAAHELKTPLAILQGQLERVIGMAETGSDIQVMLSGILDEVRRLSEISRKLLLLSQADAGCLALHREPFDLSAAVTDLVHDVQMLAPRLRISSEVQTDLCVLADGSLLRQIFYNLLSNAVKYNIDAGWIKVAASRSKGRIEVVVSNSSPGMPIGDREKIFERFFRGDPAHERKVEGVGLGLSVAREIARAHQGEITLVVDKDDSVSFILHLPGEDYGSQPPGRH